MNVERYIAIEHPIYYRRTITNKKVIIGVLILWLIVPPTVIVARISSDDSEAKNLQPAVFFTIFILITSICTVKVHITANRQRRRIVNAEQTTSEQEEHQIRLKEYKQTISMSLMVLASVILYCPFIAVTIVQSIKGKEVTHDFKYIATTTSVLFINLQSLVNPIIFSLRLSYIREGVKNKLFCWK